VSGGPNPVINASVGASAGPRVGPQVGLLCDECGYLAYDAERDRLHELNAAGALILELCDGSRPIAEIRSLAAPYMPEGAAGAVDRFIGEGLESGLLVTANGSAERSRELAAGELAQLAERLRGRGEIDAAIRCAKKVAAVTPDDPGAWHALGSMARRAGRRSLAADAYEKYLTARPDDAAIRHLLIALRDEPPPARAGDECIRLTFADFSSHYDAKMRDQLSYRAPERLANLIAAELGDASGLWALDLGCGTGLAGAVLKPRAAHLAGIDLSPEMIEMARARGIYDSLEVAEITEWLGQAQLEFDLIAACDCLVYFGDLAPMAQAAAARLKPGGHFAFTVERGERYPLHLTDSGRFTHHPDHIREVAAQSGLEVLRLEESFLRTEAGAEVIGLLALLRKPPTA